MKVQLPQAIVFATCLTWSCLAQQPKAHEPASEAPDKQKVSYALGMNMGLDLKPMGVQLDSSRIAAAVRDVMEGKATELKDSDLMEVFNQVRTNGLAQAAAMDNQRVSYALGMRMAVQLKRSGGDIDGAALGQGVNDVMAGKPTKIQAAEIPDLLHQAQTYSLTRLSKMNKTEGQTFLAKNANTPGLKVLPSGLQYRILEAGGSTAPTTSDLIFIKYRGTLLDGREFDHSDHYLVQTTGGIQAWQQALQRMKVGAKWQLFVPSELGFGHEGEPARQVGPDATLIYELSLLEIVKPGDPRIGTGRVGHGLDGGIPEAASAGADKGR